ncbi:hypothetical protein [Bradyrhizobium diversitatis]|uniref:hypothetical protein n=1 Tax=Bradyrhizobium diversitatis TaxID=2755406 RepID=UPI0035D8DBEB
MEGVCGTCETRVLEGIPDHRDPVSQQGGTGDEQDDDDLLFGREGSATAFLLRTSQEQRAPSARAAVDHRPNDSACRMPRSARVARCRCNLSSSKVAKA